MDESLLLNFYKSILKAEEKKFSELIQQQNEINLNEDKNMCFIINLCFDDIINSKNINKVYRLVNILLEKNKIDKKLFEKEKLEKIFEKIKNIYNNTKEKLNNNIKQESDKLLLKIEGIPDIDLQIRFLSKIYYLFDNKSEIVKFIIQENMIKDKKDVIKIFLGNKKNFENINTIEELYFYEYLFLEINNIDKKLEYKCDKKDSSVNNFKILKICEENIDNLNYLNDLWNVFYFLKSEKLVDEILKTLYQIYNKDDKNIKNLLIKCKDILNHQKTDDNNNIFKLIKYIIIESEKKLIEDGFIIDIRSHNLLCKKSIVKINFDENEKNKELLFWGNCTFNQIIYFLNNLNSNCIYNITGSNKDIDMNKSLNESKKNTFKISSKKLEKDISILKKENKLTPKFEKILNNWFNHFSKGKEKMTKEELAVCFNILSAKKDKQFTDKSLKIWLFLRFYSDNYEYIILDNFKKYFCTTKKIDDIWKNISNMKFRYDLNKVPQIKEKNLLMRYYLSNQNEENKELYLIDILLKDDFYKKSKNKYIYDLLCFLSTNEKIYDDILNNFNTNNIKFSQRDKEYLYNLYIINIIESIFEDVEFNNGVLYQNLKVEENFNNYLNKQNDNIDLKNKFFIEFIKNNYSDLVQLMSKNLEKMNIGIKDNTFDIGNESLVIKLYIKYLELIFRIYNFYYNNVFLSKEEKNNYCFGNNILKELFEKNNLEKLISEQKDYNNLVNQSLILLELFSPKENKSIENVQSLLEISFQLVISLILNNKEVFQDIKRSSDKNYMLNNILKMILCDKQTFNINNLRKINFYTEEFLSYLLNLIFIVLNDLKDKNPEKILSLFIMKIFTNFGTKNENTKLIIKYKILEVFFNYINDPNNFKEKAAFSFLKNYVENEKSKEFQNELIQQEFDNTYLYELIFKKIYEEEEIKLNKKNENYKNLNKLLLEGDKFMEYNETKTKIEEIFSPNSNNTNSINDDLIKNFKWCIESNIFKEKTFKEIISSLKSLLSQTEKESNENIENNEKENKKPKIKKTVPYVGIKNIGSLCYLGSIIQQLFWIPEFKYSILNADDLKPKDPSYELLDDDNILHQTQKLFTFLSFTSYGEVESKDFVLSIKDQSGKRISPNESLDSSEFYQNFCDKIKESLDNTKYKYLIEDLFGIKIIEKKICSECGECNYKKEEYKNIALDVKNIKDLYQSLDNFISEEIINDYKCQKCNKNVILKKFSTIEKLPNFMVIKLNKMNYNNKGEIEKINSIFEYPMELDLKKYCAENNNINDMNDIYIKKDEYYKYKLRGINIHMGSVEGGHFISLIKTEENKWYIFDDSSVKEYDINNLSKELYGSNDEKEQNGSTAFILFYESEKEKPIKISLNENEFNELKKDNNYTIIEYNQEDANDILKKYDINELNNSMTKENLIKNIFYDKDKNIYYKYIYKSMIEKNIKKEYVLEVFNDNCIYEKIYQKDKIIDTENYLVKLLLNDIDGDNFNITEKKLNFGEYKNLVEIVIKLIINYYSDDSLLKNNDEKDIKSLLNVINKIFLPIFKENNILQYQSDKNFLAKNIKEVLFSNKNIKLIFMKGEIKELNSALYNLFHLIIEENKKNNNNIFSKTELYEQLILLIQNGKNISCYFYKILYEIITYYYDNNDIDKNDVNCFADLYYKSQEENELNLIEIGKIFQYLIKNKNIIEKNEGVSNVINADINSYFVKILLDVDIQVLIDFAQKIQFDNEKNTDKFIIEIISKLYVYCLKDKDNNIIRERQLKLMKLILGILEITDKYSAKRIKILLGFPTLIFEKDPEKSLTKFGIKLLSNDINKELFEYSNYNMIKKHNCLLSYLFPYKNEESKLEKDDITDLIYELIKISLGLNSKKEGNYFLFKTLFLMQSRSIKYDNLYYELKDILQNSGKNEYDLNEINKEEKELIEIVNYEVESFYNIINISKTKNAENLNKNTKIKPKLNDRFEKWKDLIREGFNTTYIGCICNIFPFEIGKIEVSMKISGKSLDVLKFKFFTTFFTKKELKTLAEENREFTYKNIKRDELPKDDMDNKQEENELIIDFSIFETKKDLKELISYFVEKLKENRKIIIQNKEIADKNLLKNTVDKYYAFSLNKKTVIKAQITLMQMEPEEKVNCYLPEFIHNSIEENQAINLFNIHMIKKEFKFFETNDINVSIKLSSTEKYLKEMFG